MLGLALAAGSAALGTWAKIREAAKMKEARADLEKRKQELDMEYMKDVNLDYLNTPQAQSALSMLSKKYIENVKRVNQGAVISGRSPENTIAATEELQKPYTETLSRLAGYGQQRQDALKSSFWRREDSLNDLIYGTKVGEAQSWSNMAENAGNAVGAFTMMDAYGEDRSGLFKNLKNRRVLRGAGKIPGNSAFPNLAPTFNTSTLKN